jgi:CubicO group peptidase (beta-lactamase class C family)
MPRAWRSRIVSTAMVCAAGLAIGCGSASSPTTPDPTSSAATSAALDGAFALARQEPNLTSLVVARNGLVERQQYFNGGAPDTPQYVWSVTKSILALTVGLALERGCLRSLDQTLGELLGPAAVADGRKAAITLRQLLTMTSGLDFPEMASYTSGPSLYQEWISAPDQVAWVLARPLTASPGERFEYGSGTIHLASVALTNACGTGTAEYAQVHLFAPLGIPPREWEVDRQGFNNGGAGLNLSPRDMQAIGNLVLNAGRVEGQAVVPASWVGEMTRPQVATGPGMPAPSYGYGWWVGEAAGAGYVMANGWGGQFIVVVPTRRLVVTAAARTSGLGGADAMAQWQRVFAIITGRIVAAYPPAAS